LNASELLAQTAANYHWSSEDQLAMICSYADVQEAFWSTPSLPGSRPCSFADFLKEVTDAIDEYAAANEDDGTLASSGSDDAPDGVYGEENEASEDVEDGPPPLTEGALLSKAGNHDAVVMTFDKTIALTVPQMKKSTAWLGDDYDPDAENAPAEGEVIVGPLVASFTTPSGDPAELAVSARAGRPVCFVQAVLFIKGKEVKYLQPRHQSLVGDYSVEYGGAVYKLSIVAPARRAAK
jgi:hypothetical protein